VWIGPIVAVVLGVLLIAVGRTMTSRSSSLRGSMWKPDWTPGTGFATPKGIFAQAGVGALFIGALLIIVAIVWAATGG
jgi:hypothetical protein